MPYKGFEEDRIGFERDIDCDFVMREVVAVVNGEALEVVATADERGGLNAFEGIIA